MEPDPVPNLYLPSARHCTLLFESTVHYSPKRPGLPTAWIAISFEAALVLLIAGFVLLSLNPFWHLDQAGFLDFRAHWWNGMGAALIGAGLAVGTVAAIGLFAALVSRCFPSRPLWPYLLAAAAVVGYAAWLGLNGTTRTYDARFEWDSADGFKVFRLQTADPRSSPPPENPAWLFLVANQVQPVLRGYFGMIDWQRINGDISVTVVRGVPIAWPLGLGGEGETIEDPDETALMQAIDKSDLNTVKQLITSGTDINARDQDGQTALIRACRNPNANPPLIKVLLGAGADVNARSRNDYTALGWATARGNNPVIQLLRQAGAKP